MAIEYVEIRGSNLEVIGIVDTAKSIIWHSKFFSVGNFEIYVQASPEIIALLQVGNYVTRPDDLEVGIIEAIYIADNPQDGMMVTASGRFAKSLLDRRIIYNLSGNTNTPTILKGNVETEVRRLVTENAINCPWDELRNMQVLALGELANLPQNIVGDGDEAQTQVFHDNLLTYTDALLQQYGLGATVILDEAAHRLRYVIYAGADRSVNNSNGNDPIIFSKEFDNLTDSSYEYNEATYKNVALVGGEGEGIERFYAMVMSGISDILRREVWVDASSVTRKYKDENDTEKTYTDEEYTAMLRVAGRQTLQANTTTERFDGIVDIQNSAWKYNRDFALGDIVTVQNADIGKYINMRLREVLEVQDENGYAIEANNQT